MTIKKASACVFALLILVLPGCSRLYFFDGIVVDGDGKPISGATVMLYPSDWDRSSQLSTNGESGDDGKFEATWGNAVGVEYFRIVIASDGYLETQQLVEADQENLRIVLERDPDATDSVLEPE